MSHFRADFSPKRRKGGEKNEENAMLHNLISWASSVSSQLCSKRQKTSIRLTLCSRFWPSFLHALVVLDDFLRNCSECNITEAIPYKEPGNIDTTTVEFLWKTNIFTSDFHRLRRRLKYGLFPRTTF